MSPKTNPSSEERIELISEALNNAISDLRVIRQYKLHQAESKIRCAVLIATLRSAVNQAVGLAKNCEVAAEEK
jgi:hypothetical protein